MYNMQGVEFADSIYDTLIHQLERRTIQKECSEWLHIFIKLINFTDSAAVKQLHLLISKKYRVLKDTSCKKKIKEFVS